MEREALLLALNSAFNESQLRTLCFLLSVDYDNLDGKTKDAKARELILHCERTEQIDKLIETARKERPYFLNQAVREEKPNLPTRPIAASTSQSAQGASKTRLMLGLIIMPTLVLCACCAMIYFATVGPPWMPPNSSAIPTAGPAVAAPVEAPEVLATPTIGITPTPTPDYPTPKIDFFGFSPPLENGEVSEQDTRLGELALSWRIDPTTFVTGVTEIEILGGYKPIKVSQQEGEFHIVENSSVVFRHYAK